MRKILFLMAVLLAQTGCLDEKQQAEKILRHYIDRKEEPIRTYSMESAVALWNATVSGNENDYQKLIEIELEFNKTNQNPSGHFAPDRFLSISQNVFTNEQDFEMLRKLKYSGLITDTLLNRQLNVLYQAFMGPQIETEKYKKFMSTEVKLWKAFSELKIKVGDKEYAGNQIDSIRENASDGQALKHIFEEYRAKGKELAPEIILMIKARNEFARNFGYANFYELSLEAKDQTSEKVKLLLDGIELKTRDQFLEAKGVIDKLLAKRFGIAVEELKPWHYNDERTSYLPRKFTNWMDSLFVAKDPIHIASAFFNGIGLPVQDVFDNSDLEYRSGKSSLNAMINVDFKNDIRLISSIQSTHEGMARIMHLGGHASHYKAISDNIPYLLKTPNSVLTEGIARYFESLASNCDWLADEAIVDSTNQKQYLLVCRHLNQVDQLFRCRKLLALAEFEREIYRAPGQDLDQLWSRLASQYMGINYPEEKNACYWATNKYTSSLSCTIQNFVLADVFAAQLQHTIERDVIMKTGHQYGNNKAIGQFLVNRLYRPGNIMSWEDLIEKSTGEPLNTEYFVNDLIEK